MSAAAPRQFHASDAKRAQVPLLVGLFGPSSSGKTFTALRLATGMQSVSGGDIYVIDTEAKRALHYADRFKFKHVPFEAPFGSLDYLAAIQWCAAQGAKTIVIDSMSHEHEGVGGHLQTHDAELTRLAGDDYAKRDKMNFTAWIKPAGNRRALINGILQLDVNLIFCWRAKEKLKIVPGRAPTRLGFMPIAGEEFLFECTTAALLAPGAKGVPTWEPAGIGERTMAKTAEQFAPIYERQGPLDETVGRMLATWAAGGSINAAPTQSPEEAAAAAETYCNDVLRQLGTIEANGDEDAFDDLIARTGKAMVKLKTNHPTLWDTVSARINEARAAIKGPA